MTEKRFVTTTVEIEGREEIAVVEVRAFESPPWGKDAALDAVGQRLSRLDALDKVTGAARYTHDIRLPGMLHARLVRASIPAGWVARLDLSRGRAVPGVRAVLTGADLPRIPHRGGVVNPELAESQQHGGIILGSGMPCSSGAVPRRVRCHRCSAKGAASDAGAPAGSPSDAPIRYGIVSAILVGIVSVAL